MSSFDSKLKTVPHLKTFITLRITTTIQKYPYFRISFREGTYSSFLFIFALLPPHFIKESKLDIEKKPTYCILNPIIWLKSFIKKFYFESSKCKHIKDSSSSVDKIFIETLKRDDTVQIKLHWGCHERLLIFFKSLAFKKAFICGFKNLVH